MEMDPTMEQGTRNSGKSVGEECLECRVCKTVFQCGQDLKSHMNTHIKGKTPHKRSQCHKKFRRGSLRRRHPLVDNGVKPCNKLLPGIGSLQRHRRVHAYVSADYLCSGTVRKHRRGLLKHYSCTHCHKTFLHKYQLTKHVLNRDNSRPRRCKHCHRTFCTSHDFIIHAKKAHSKSDVSEQLTADKTSLTVEDVPEQLTTDKTSLALEDVTEQFTDKEQQQLDAKNGTEDTVTEQLTTDKEQQHADANKITEDQLYSCTHCHKTFLHKYQLTKHVLNRDNSRPRRCKHCHRTFCTSHDFIIHAKKAHSKSDVSEQLTADKTSLTVEDVPEQLTTDKTSLALEDVTEQFTDKEQQQLDAKNGTEDTVTEQLTTDKEQQHADANKITEDQSCEDSLNEQLQRIEVHDQIKKEIKTEGTATCTLGVPGLLQDDNGLDTDVSDGDGHCEMNTDDNVVTAVPKDMIKPQIQREDPTSIRSIFGERRTKSKPNIVHQECFTSWHNEQELSETVMNYDETLVESQYQNQGLGAKLCPTPTGVGHSFALSHQNSSTAFVDGSSNMNEQKQTVLDFVTDNDDHLTVTPHSVYQKQAINICSQDNYKLRAANASYTHSDGQHSCVVKICGEKAISVQTAQSPVSSTNVVHCGEKVAEQVQHNKKDMLISGGMPSIHDICTTAGACEQRTDTLKGIGAFMDKAGKANTDFVSVQYGPVNRCPTNGVDEDFSLEKGGYANFKSSFEVQFGPLTLNDTLAADKIQFSPMRLDTDYATNKACLGHAGICVVANEAENIEGILYGPPTLEDVQYGSANMFDDRIVQQSNTNVEEAMFHSESNCLSPSRFEPSNVSSVYYGPPNRTDLHFGLANNDNNQLTLNSNELQHDVDMKRVQYGPLNLNELEYDQNMIDDQLRATGSFEIPYGPKNWDEMEVDSTNLAKEQYGPAKFNEIPSMNEIPFGPANIDDINTGAPDLCDMHFKPSNFQEEQFVSYGPPNIYDLKDAYLNSPEKIVKTLSSDANDQANAQADNSDTDCLNSSLMDFPHLNTKSNRQSDMFHEHSVAGIPPGADYTTVGGLNLGPVHELTDMIVSSCMKADPTSGRNKVDPSKRNMMKNTGLRSGETLPAGNIPAGKDSPLCRSEAEVSHTIGRHCTVNSEKVYSPNALINNETTLDVGSGYHLETAAATSKLCSIINASPTKQSDLSKSKKVEACSTKAPPPPPVCIFTCEICNERISGRENMAKHVLTHSQLKPFVCKICFKTFTKKGHLTTHYKLCKVLNGKSKNLGNNTLALGGANNHISNNHIPQSQNCTEMKIKELQFACNICKASFSHQSQLKKHALTHLEEAQTLYKCDICSAVFRHNGTLQAHRRTHTGEKPYKCAHCDKSFTQNSQLTVHVRSRHTNERPFVCKQCNKGFSDKGHYQRHALSHSGERPFACEVCARAFSQRSQLKTHMKTHNDVKEHVCGLCQKQLSSKHSLKKHLAMHEKQGL